MALARIEEARIMAIVVAPRWTVTPYWDQLTVEEVVELWRSRDISTAKPEAWLPRLGTLMATVVRGQRANNH